jgi:hypothetical protein
MSVHSSFPAQLEPHSGEHGLASGDPLAIASEVDSAWTRFAEVAAAIDLSLPSRKKGWTGWQVVAHIGSWPGQRNLETILADAHDGNAYTMDQHAADNAVLAATVDASDDEILASVSRAHLGYVSWLSGDGPTTWGKVLTSSPLGPLPVTTVVFAATYQLGVALLDLRPCGAPVDEIVSQSALLALLDTTGALAARKRVDGTFTAVTPTGIVGAGSLTGNWRTERLAEDPQLGPGVVAPAHVVLDVTSGRSHVPHLYRSGQLHVRDLQGLIRLAPVLEGVPGVPPLGAVGRAMAVVDVVGGLVGRLGRSRRH